MSKVRWVGNPLFPLGKYLCIFFSCAATDGGENVSLGLLVLLPLKLQNGPQAATSKNMVWWYKEAWEKGTVFHLHPPFPLLYLSPTLEKAILSTWSATDPVVVISILSYILREICLRGLNLALLRALMSLIYCKDPLGWREQAIEWWGRQSTIKGSD